MKRAAAEEVIQAMRRIDNIAGELVVLSDQIDDEAEKKMHRAAAILIAAVHENVTLEIVKQFPDLHPDKDSSSTW